MFNRKSFVQIVRFGIVGIVQNGAGYLLYLLITWLGVDPKLTVSILYPISAVISYFGNKHWSFEYDGSFASSSVRFIITHIASYSLNMLLLFYFVDILFFPHQYIQLLAMFVCAIFLFLTLKFFVFPKSISENRV